MKLYWPFVRAAALAAAATIAEVAGEEISNTAGCAFTVVEVVEDLKRTVVATAAPALPATGAVAAEVEIEVTYSVVSAVAEAGATEVRTPKPKAATVTSAMRLKVVFVDICFLSISRDREFPVLGLKLNFLTSFSMNRTC
jgi:cytoskeletal protein RodZ